MILTSFKLQNPITARKDKNVRSKNIRRLESGWRRKGNPKTLPSRTKEFILDNPLEAAVLGVGGVLSARYLVKGIKASKLNPRVLGANNVVSKNTIISTLTNAKKAFDDDVVKVKNVWNTITTGKTLSSKQNNKIKIAERKNKISNQIKTKNTDLTNLQQQIKTLKSQYIDPIASKSKQETVYKKGVKAADRKLLQSKVKQLTNQIKRASTRAVKSESSYNLKSHLSFF